MKRREFLANAGASLLAPAAFRGLPPSAPASLSRPNVLLILTDDQRFDTVGALGNPVLRTPNMDRLVRSGVAFTRAHIMGAMNGAVCIPSRAMLLTGRTLFHLEKLGQSIPVSDVMLPELLKKAGYRTHGIGKWHNGKESYARAFGSGGPVMFGGMSDHTKVPFQDFDPTGEYPDGRQKTGAKFSSEMFSDAAVAFLEGYGGTAPFFLYLAYTAPHDPRMAPPEFARLYDPGKIELPGNFLPRHPFDNGEMEIRDEKLTVVPRDPASIRKEIAGYYAMITHVDREIGRVLDALEKTGRAGSTIIVFAGDNGLAVGQHGLLGKQSLYDHSVRVPLIISGPGIPKGRKAGTFCYLLDVYPTLCRMLGIEAPSTADGTSLVPALRDSSATVRDELFLAYTKLQRGLKTSDNWKLIRYMVNGIETVQLFNLNIDPLEIRNLAARPEEVGRVASMTAELKARMKEAGDFCDLDKPHWN